MTDIRCQECGKTATQIVWGCCEFYRVPMCNTCAIIAVGEDWGRATKSCERTESEDLNEYMTRTNGYAFR